MFIVLGCLNGFVWLNVKQQKNRIENRKQFRIVFDPRAISKQAALGTIHSILRWANVRGSASDCVVKISLLFSDTDLLNAMLMH